MNNLINVSMDFITKAFFANFPFLEEEVDKKNLEGGWSKRVSGGHLYILEAPQSANWNSSPGHNLLSALHIFMYNIHMFSYIKNLIS